MSERNTTRTARNLVAVFAVALLCAAAMAVVIVDSDEGDAATTTPGGSGGTDSGTDNEPVVVKHKVKVTITNGTTTVAEKEVVEGQSFTATVKSNSGYVLPLQSKVTTSGTSTSENKFSYSLNSDRTSATVKVENVKKDCQITIACEKTADVYMIYKLEGKETSKLIEGDAYPGLKISGEFPDKDGYNLPTDIVVSNGAQLDIEIEYSSSTGKFSFTIPDALKATQNVNVYGEYTNKEYTFTSSIIGGDVDKKADVKPVHNNSLQFKITAGPHYDLPDPRDVTVTNDGKNKSYTYDATTGIVKIGKVEGNITVTAKCNAETFTVTYYDSDKKTELDMEPSRFSYGIGCTLPTNVVKTDYIFTGWVDEAGRPIAAVDKAWAPSEGKEGNVNVYATFKDDLSKYDVGDYQMPYLIAAILSMVALIAVPVIVKVRK